MGVTVTHLCPPDGESFTPCCGRTPFALPLGDHMTLDVALVTCPGLPSPEAVAAIEEVIALTQERLEEDVTAGRARTMTWKYRRGRAWWRFWMAEAPFRLRSWWRTHWWPHRVAQANVERVFWKMRFDEVWEAAATLGVDESLGREMRRRQFGEGEYTGPIPPLRRDGDYPEREGLEVRWRDGHPVAVRLLAEPRGEWRMWR